MVGGLESRCVGRVYGEDGAMPETCRAKNTSIKLPCCVKLAFQNSFLLVDSPFLLHAFRFINSTGAHS